MQRRQTNPTIKRAFNLLRAVSRLGVPGALPAPPQLLPAGAKVLAQGYLNRFSMPLLREWLLPPWMRLQSDPSSPLFTPRSVSNLMLNQTGRNWTALGIPGYGHPIESIVDKWGLLTPIPGGPSLDWWVDLPAHEAAISALTTHHLTPTIRTMAPSLQNAVLQRLQGGLPVVLTAYEANGLRVSSEAWMLPLPGADWAVMQVVLFNIADLPLRGTFSFALRPYNAEGISPIYNIAYDGATLIADGRRGPVTWPQHDGWAVSDLSSGDLFSGNTLPNLPRRNLTDPRGFAHGVLRYSFSIEPWEEAEFLAFLPVHTRNPAVPTAGKPLFTVPQMEIDAPDSAFYSRAKASVTLGWQELLDNGMRVSVPDRALQISWEANRAHVLALHDGGLITPGPDLYHSFWFRDAAYMVHALSLCGYKEAAVQLLRGFLRWQRRSGAFVSHHGEWDSTGQVLWALGRHLDLHPDSALVEEYRPSIVRARRWIARTLLRSEGGLMPPGTSSEHLGPPDRYYWDSLWSLAGLLSADRMLGKRYEHGRGPANRLRRNILRAWRDDASLLGGHILPAAPGRKVDLGMVGTLVAWFPLGLFGPASPYLRGTLDALESATFYDGALFVAAGHSGWGTYLNMRLAGCRIANGLDGGWELVRWLLDHASPTYNWPEAIHPHSGGGSAGDGHHGWASAEWLMLVRALLFDDAKETLQITPGLPEEWLYQPGKIEVEHAPTTFGKLAYTVEWDEGGRNIRLSLSSAWHTPPGAIQWFLPGHITSAKASGYNLPVQGGKIILEGQINTVEVRRET